VAARSELLESGIGGAVIAHIADQALSLPARSAVVDLGSGTGHLIAAIVERAPVDAIGIDLSVAAVERAARRCPSATWVVANADRRLPLGDGSVTLITSLNARRQPRECARVLAREGRLVGAVPAGDDLSEPREFVGGHLIERDRSERVIADHEPAFALIGRDTIREHHQLNRQQLVQLLRASYRGGRHSAAPRVEQLDTLAVTMATDVMLFGRR
jgi:23S rRNA (guanine745-N1)-methyltransferase